MLLVERQRALEAGIDAAGVDDRIDELRHLATSLLLRGRAGEDGAKARACVDTIIEALRSTVPVLRACCERGRDRSSAQWGLGRLELLDGWRDLLAPGHEGEPTAARLLTTLLHLEVASVTLGDGTPTGLSIPVELVQVSAQTENAFAMYSRTGDDKLGGWSVNRFGGFLKRSWRVNDWTWGRLDAATALCRTVLDPERVRRTALLAGYLRDGDDPAALADETLRGITTTLLPGDPLADDSRYVHLVGTARQELTQAFDLGVPREDLPAMMPALAAIFAWARQLDLIPEEMAALAAAVRQDDVEGASPRSRGMALLKEEEPLLTRLEKALGRERPVAARDRVRLLAAFDRAGVGREDLSVETSSDLVIRSASTAGAVAASVLDSPSSGLAAVRPVTKVVRGAMLVVHWTVVGLTSRSVIPRTLAMLGLALGSVMLVASLLGTLPESWSGPASLIGSSCLLAAFAFGALRTGTFLHGLVLLSPIVPLLTYAFSLPGVTRGHRRRAGRGRGVRDPRCGDPGGDGRPRARAVPPRQPPRLARKRLGGPGSPHRAPEDSRRRHPAPAGPPAVVDRHAAPRDRPLALAAVGRAAPRRPRRPGGPRLGHHPAHGGAGAGRAARGPRPHHLGRPRRRGRRRGSRLPLR